MAVNQTDGSLSELAVQPVNAAKKYSAYNLTFVGTIHPENQLNVFGLESKFECPNCGFPVEEIRGGTCPKCETVFRGQGVLPVLEVDVVHEGETWYDASEKIERAVYRAIAQGHKGVKIVHGYGAFRGVSIIRPRAIALMKQLAEKTGGVLAPDRGNPGAHLIWFNR